MSRRVFVKEHRRADGSVVKAHWKTVHEGDHVLSTAKNTSLSGVKSDFQTTTPSPEPILLSDNAEKVIDSLLEIGTPYIVGGAVRDSVMGNGEPKDIDIEVHGDITMEHMVQHLRSHGFSADEVGKSFGVLKVVCGGEDFDVSLPRRDSLPDDRGSGKHTDISAVVDGTMGVEEASRRRDFTINAIMYDPDKEEYIDPHGGLSDIKDGILRAVDEDSFAEDPLRVLRGVQFSGRFDMDLDKDTEELCRSLRPSGLARERIAGELRKMVLKSTNFDQGVATLYSVGWQEVASSLNGKRPVDPCTLSRITSHPDPRVAMGMATSYISSLYGMGREEEHKSQISRDLMLSKVERRHAGWFNCAPTTHADYSRVLRGAYDAGVDYDTIDLVLRNRDIDDRRFARPWEGAPPPYEVDGNRLREMGYTPSPAFKHIIREAQERQDSGHPLSEPELRRLANHKIRHFG